MELHFFNTLSRSVETFTPLDVSSRKVGMYCCGPTVYDFAHIGNWRTFIFADLVRRWLEFAGFEVRHVTNITDVEDKIIRRVRETSQSLRGFTSLYESAFFEDLKTLNCLQPHETPRATEHIAEIISLIGQLITAGVAYQAADASIYFSIEKYRNSGATYGQLLKLNFEASRVGERVATDEYEKESVADFALWKARVPEDGDVFWPSPWGDGRPGWHIECSAMSMKYLGSTFDLHLGGEDLIFPHHEDEIAQSEAACKHPPGNRFVKYWLHGAHLLVEGRKMSKSLGNYFTLRDLQARGFSGREIRQLLLSARYRDSFNFTIKGLGDARSALERIDECLMKMRGLAGSRQAPPEAGVIAEFTAALQDDLNISAAWATIFNWVRELNSRAAEQSLNPEQAAAALSTWARMDSVLGLGSTADASVPAEIKALVEARQAARQAREFKRSDSIREELKARGWLVEDTPNGPRARPVRGPEASG